MKRKKIDINKILQKIDSCDGANILIAIFVFKNNNSFDFNFIQHKMETSFAKTSKLLDFFVAEGVLHKTAAAYYEVLISKDEIGEIIYNVNFEPYTLTTRNMEKKEIDIHKLLQNCIDCDRVNIVQALKTFRGDERCFSFNFAYIQDETETEYEKAAEFLDLFVETGILWKIFSPHNDGRINITYETQISETYAKWLLDIICFEEQIKEYNNKRDMTQTLNAMEFIRKKHTWHKRKDNKFYEKSSWAMACETFNELEIRDDNAIATILIQNMVACDEVSIEELPVTENVRNSIEIMAFRVLDGETKELAQKRYYNMLLEDREATLAKLVDKYYTIKNEESYEVEIREYIFPFIKKAQEKYRSDYSVLSSIKFKFISIIDPTAFIIRL